MINKQEIKDLLSQKAYKAVLDVKEAMLVKRIKGGKLKKTKRSTNVAQANRMTGTTPQQRRKADRKRQKTNRKTQIMNKSVTKKKRQRSMKKGERQGLHK